MYKAMAEMLALEQQREREALIQERQEELIPLLDNIRILGSRHLHGDTWEMLLGNRVKIRFKYRDVSKWDGGTI